MAVLPVLTLGAPRLREPARAVTPDELASAEVQSFIDDLLETMDDRNGAGLAATQVGRGLRIAAVHVRAPNPRYPYKPPIPRTVLVNPVVTPLGDETFDNYEGCLSVPDLRGVVRRHVRVRVEFLDRHGQPHVREVAGISAGTYQHELDHLDGVVFVDRVQDPHTLCTWANFAEHHVERFAAYAAELTARYEG
jgi:peptide deformylase